MSGIDPRFPAEWALRDGSGGCRRRTELNCTGDDGFATLTNMKLPESANATVDMSLGLDECRLTCLRNCACRAYASANLSSPGATGCFMWTGDLLDMRQFGNGGQNLFVRLAASDLREYYIFLFLSDVHSNQIDDKFGATVSAFPFLFLLINIRRKRSLLSIFSDYCSLIAFEI